MGKLKDYARNELELAGHFDEDAFYGGMVGEAVMELMEVFEKQGHSGMSAPLVSKVFKRVANQRPLTPLKCTEDEWNEAMSDGVFQNIRCSAVFKEGKSGTPYYIEAIVWRQPNGGCFTGTVEGVKSGQHIEPPFMPKTFYIDVDENGEKIIDRDQLEDVFEHYINPNQTS